MTEHPAELSAGYGEILREVVAAHARRGGRPLVLGICGSQGSGKSTLAALLQEALQKTHGLSVAVLSLDDLYLPSRERARLAREVHPLLQTRGVPGTHNVDLGHEVIQQLISATPQDVTRLPRFDKAIDEPFAQERWPHTRGRADVVIFEGWCVGAAPQDAAALVEPINELERNEDPQGHWRRYVNQQLAGPYQQFFARLSLLLMLRAPAFEIVFEWRREQERKLEAATKASGAGAATRIMNDAQLHRFIMHYERLTRHILVEMPRRADVVVQLDPQRRILALERAASGSHS